MAEQTESSWTESRFRQRLVGASVVVALAVLLLPLWLDGSGIDSLRVQTAPEKPEVEGAERIEVPQPPGETGEPLENPPTSLFPDQTPIEAREASASDAAPSGGESVEEREEAAASTPEDVTPESEREAAQSASQPADEGSVVESAPERAPSEEDTESAPAEESAAAKADENASGGDLPESSASGEYVVQLGSFSDERNARALAESVESSGFDVSVTPLFSEQGTVWRVRVGPYATRDLAGEATERLRQRIGRDGLVMTK
ncbi:hypothetical protein GM160_05410 [Guyparkeria halophila]|uniref:SPOR domain-containing protein n=1 Tax=Guyparkeria halophila TaxID=47960 RepID=A0A6I6CW90_9GAMM|nr:SPOR domain-containing protein [Guyparkeria halophila]QGT78379.1 hypothetical protein GM160_05410 [Guyparkeria halophila]